MRIIAVSLVGLCACVASEPDMVIVEPHFGTLVPSNELSLREGIAVPAASIVTLDGKGYRLTYIPEGGTGYTDDNGPAFTDRVLVGGAGAKLEAVAVYLHFCREIDEVIPVWADEYVPTLKGTGEYVFDYPDACPAFEIL